MSTNPKPLLLQRCGVLITRPSAQADHLAHLLQASGANIIRWPTLAIVAPQDPSEAIDLVDLLSEFHVAVFVSVNAVDHGLELIKTQNQTLDQLKVVAIGNATAEQLRLHDVDAITPTLDATSEGVLALPVFWAPAINGKRVLIFRGVGGRETLGETLRARGAEVHYAEVYQRIKPDSDPRLLQAALDDELIDVLTVTSAEGLQNLESMVSPELQDRLHDLPVVVMSERLAGLAKELGYRGPVLVSTSQSDTGIVEALERWRGELAEAATLFNEPASVPTPLEAVPAVEAPDSSGAHETLRRAAEPLLAEAEDTLASLRQQIEDAATEAGSESETTAASPVVEKHSGPMESAQQDEAENVAVTEPEADLPVTVDEASSIESSVPESTKTPLDRSPPPPPPPPVAQAAAKHSNWPAWLALAFGAGALGYQLYWTQTAYTSANAAVRAQIEDVDNRLKGLSGKLPESDKLKSDLGALEDKAAAELKTVASTVEEVRQQGKALSDAFTALEQRTPQGNDDWVLAEVDYLVLAADERLHNGYDVSSALAALKTADDRLRSLSRPNLKPLREQLLKDTNAIKALPQLDISGQSMYLVDLLNRVETLPLKGGDIVSKPKPEIPSPATEEEKKSFSLTALSRAMWQDLTSLVRIEETDLKDSVTFEPEFRYFLQEHLRLEIAGARLDLVRRNPQDLKASVTVIKNLLGRFYDANTEAVKSINARLDEIASLDLQPAIPDLSKSLEVVREYRDRQRRPDAAVKPDTGAESAPKEPQPEPAKPTDSSRGDAQ